MFVYEACTHAWAFTVHYNTVQYDWSSNHGRVNAHTCTLYGHAHTHTDTPVCLQPTNTVHGVVLIAGMLISMAELICCCDIYSMGAQADIPRQTVVTSELSHPAWVLKPDIPR